MKKWRERVGKILLFIVVHLLSKKFFMCVLFFKSMNVVVAAIHIRSEKYFLRVDAVV